MRLQTQKPLRHGADLGRRTQPGAFLSERKAGTARRHPRYRRTQPAAVSGQPFLGLCSGRHTGPSPGRIAGPHRVPARDTHQPAGPGAPCAPSDFSRAHSLQVGLRCM